MDLNGFQKNKTKKHAGNVWIEINRTESHTVEYSRLHLEGVLMYLNLIFGCLYAK